jgi:hypothetical protein
VIARFKERTGIAYTRRQFKNKWNKLKQDYGIWKKLKRNDIGLGWDESGKNIVMPEAWWKKIAKVSGIIVEVVSFYPFFLVKFSVGF